jgi:polysaccharide export outer membrane protein
MVSNEIIIVSYKLHAILNSRQKKFGVGQLAFIARNLLMVAAAVSLAACSLPRTAALQQEVVHQGTSENPSFQVVEVTRASTAQIAAWPRESTYEHRSWIGADRGPDSSVIQTGDRLEVVIWDNQENSLISDGTKQTPIPPLSVSSAGTVFLPYVGDVRVRGLTSTAARDRIQSEMEMIVPAAQVQLRHVPGRNNSVDVASGVGAPGRYPLENRNTQLLSILAIAGGVSPQLSQPRVRLQRHGQVYETQISEILKNPSMNVRMRGGDQIAVVEDGRTFTAIGASGTQALIPFQKEKLSALDGVSAAGGVDARRGNPKGVLILREYHPRDLTPGPRGPDMQQVVFSFDLTNADGLFAARQFMLQPNDTLLATESPITAVQTIAQLFGTVVGIGLSIDRIAGDD